MVGPLPPVRNQTDPYFLPYQYLLTMIARTTRWLETVPLTEITAQNLTTAFINTQVATFGVPLYIITNRGSQFESEYAAVTGCHAQVPSLFIDPYDKDNDISNLAIKDLVKEMQKFNMENHSSRHLNLSPKPYIPKDLNNCKFVWLKTDRVQKYLEALYTDQYKVTRHNNKYFTITAAEDVNSNVSIDRLKPAVVSEMAKMPDIDKAISAQRDTSPEIDKTMETKQNKN